MFTRWLTQVFDHPQHVSELLIISAKSAIVYLFLILGFRLLGKRELGQMNIYDLVLIVVIANAVQNAMVGNDATLLGGIVSAFTLLLFNRVLTLLLLKAPGVEKALIGQPILIVNDGQLMTETMAKEGLTREQVMAALREHGLYSLDQAHLCVLEIDGTISVVPKESAVFRTRRHYRALRLP